jgi:hypothetical protein
MCNETTARSAFWITPEGTIDALPALDVDASRPVLVAAGDGTPFLVAQPAMRRFDPWTGRFVVPEGVPSHLPRVSESAAGARPDPIVAIDPGAFVWLEPEGAIVRGYRHGTLGPFAQDVAPLLVAGTDRVVPNRSAGCATVTYGGSPPALWLVGPTTEIAVADTTYQDLRLEIELACEAAPEEAGCGPIDPSCEPPLVHLGSVAVGGTACPWPAQTKSRRTVATVVRTSNDLEVRLGEATTVCEPPTGRVSVRLASPGVPVAVSRLVVSRAP